MQSFNQLPFETRLEILKYYPEYRSLSSPYYKEKQLFYNLYCHDPITPKEFLRYVKDFQPNNFNIYGNRNESYYCMKFSRMLDYYSVDITILSVKQVNMNQFGIKAELYQVEQSFDIKNTLSSFTDI